MPGAKPIDPDPESPVGYGIPQFGSPGNAVLTGLQKLCTLIITISRKGSMQAKSGAARFHLL